MKLQEGLNSKKKQRGITFIEIMIVVVITASLAGSFFPLAVDFYNTRQFDVQLKNIVQALRRAQLKSMSADSDSSFGVYFTTGQCVLFKGESYALRDPSFDESFVLPDNAFVTGISEVVFDKIEGFPSHIGNINLTLGRKSGNININEVGRIDY